MRKYRNVCPQTSLRSMFLSRRVHAFRRFQVVFYPFPRSRKFQPMTAIRNICSALVRDIQARQEPCSGENLYLIVKKITKKIMTALAFLPVFRFSPLLLSLRVVLSKSFIDIAVAGREQADESRGWKQGHERGRNSLRESVTNVQFIAREQ